MSNRETRTVKHNQRSSTRRRRQQGLIATRRRSHARSQRTNLLLEAFEPRLVLAGIPQLIDLNATGASSPADFVQVGDVTFFTATDGEHGRELWRTDGTGAGTRMIKDIQPGAASSDPSALIEFDGSLYFVADDGQVGFELWRSDGTESGTVLVRDINPGQGYQYPVGDGNLNSFIQGMVVVGNRLMFNAEEANTGAELWSSDGTSSGTALVKDIAAGSSTYYNNDYPNSSTPRELVNVNGTLFFSADDGVNGRELWKSDGTAAGTVMVKDIFQGSSPYYYYGYNYGDQPNASQPEQLTAVNGILFFAATDDVHGTELWKSDGTAAGTVLVRDIQSGEYDSLYGGDSLIEFNGKLLFAADDGIDGKELWISDGTEAGTQQVKDIRPGSNGGITSGYFAEVDGTMFFAADNGTSGSELWKSDGTEAGTVLVSNLDDSASGSFPRYLTAANGRLFFSAFTSDVGREMWESDGTDAGTQLVADVSPGTGSSSPREMFDAGHQLYFSADNGTAGRELYVMSVGEQMLQAGLTIYVDSEPVSIPANIGVASGGGFLSQVHTEGSNGTLVISPIGDEPLDNVTLGDFFLTWQTNAGLAGNNPNATFDNDELMGNLADAANTVQMFVNGQISHEFDDYVIQDGDEIVLVYGANPVVSLNTNFGPIVLELFADETPGTVNNFLKYVNRGDYLNSFFHRLDPNFVIIQGGGFKTTSPTFTSTNQFSSINTDPPIANEPGLSNVRGTLAMAKLGGDPDSATSQFFVNIDDNILLDLPQNNSFTVFAQVLDMTTVDSLVDIPVDKTNPPPFGELPLTDDDQLVVIQAIEGQGRVSGVKFLDANANGALDSGETVLAGVTVYVDANQNGQLDAGEIQTLTDDQGRFLLDVEPGKHFINASVSDGRYTTLPGVSGHEVDVLIGREVENRNFGEATLEAPSGVDLVAATDTGSSNSDDLTNRNNASSESTLQFQVSGLIDGAVVNVYAGDVLLGSATAAGNTAIVTTNGTSAIADGSHNIVATQSIQGNESGDSVTLSIEIDTSPPAAIASTAPDVAQVGQVYSFNADSPDEGQVTYSLSDEPTGMNIDEATGVISWTPTIDQAVPQLFDILVTDEAGNVSRQTVELTVFGEIAALPDDYDVDEDEVLVVPANTGVLANDGDESNGTLTASLISNPAHGTVTLNADGSFSYTPNANYFGTDSFTYQATDGSADSNVATVKVEVHGINDPPTASPDSHTTAEDTPLVVTAANGVLKNDVDIDGDTLTAILANQPTDGTLTLNADGSFTYTPDENFFGTDSFAYRVSDGTVQSDPVSVQITVTPVDDPPNAVPDNYTVDEDKVLTVSAANGVLANDSDPDGDITVSLESAPSNGSLTLNSDGSFTYTPDPNFADIDSFTYRVSDGTNESFATATITVVNQPDPPTANNDTFDVADDGSSHILNVLANDTTSPDANDTISVISVTQGNQGGTVTLSGGQISYLPLAGFTGPETFQYTIEDSDGLRSTATVEVTVSDAAGNSLSGFVYLDSNGNGQRDSNEMGIPGAVISLIGVSSTGTAVNRSMITTNEGLYLFEDLPAGTYEIVERQPTAMTDGAESSSVTGADLSVNDRISNLAISGRQTFADNNFAELQLQSGYVSIAWFFASATSTSEVFRETIAQGEESAGHDELASAIRAGSQPPPDIANRAPVASADAYSLSQGSSLSRTAANGVLVNDADPDGDVLTATLESNVTHGTLAFNTDGSFTYTPTASFAGTDSFTYHVSDGVLTSNTVQVTFTIEATANTFSLAENSPTGTVVGRVQLGQGATLSYEIADTNLPDDLLLRPDDHLSGDPASVLVLIEYLDLQCPNCEAIHPAVLDLQDNFEGELLVVRRHLPLTTVHPNAFDAAVASEAAARQGKFDQMVDLLFEKQDEWNDASDPQPFFEDYADQLGLNLTQFISDQADPALAARIQRDMDAADRLGATATPTFYLNGDLVDSADATDDFEAVIEDALQDFDEPFVMNRTTGDIVVADGNQLNFESTPNFTFSVSGTKTDGSTTSATVTIHLTNVNEASPVAFADTYAAAKNTTLTVDAAQGVLKNDTDADGDVLTAIRLTPPANGSLTLNSNGSFVYVPNTDFSGTDTFTYQASDGDRTSTITTVTINVSGNNTAPVTTNDIYFATQDTTLTINAATGVLVNDDDGEDDPLTAILVQTTQHGQLTLNANGSFTYEPNAGYKGPDSFTYRANDGSLSSTVATVSINVNATNSPPVANNDNYAIDENGVLNVTAANGLLKNDQDSDLDSLSVQLVTGPTHGSLSLSPNGSFTYTPTADYHGPDSFTYLARDGKANSNTATVAIVVNSINDTPQAVADQYSVIQGNVLDVIATSGVLSNDIDPDGDSLTATVVGTPSNGSLTLNADGSFEYTPNAGFHGDDSFTYQASDGTATSNVATVSISVNPSNSFTLLENAAAGTLVGQLQLTDADIGGTVLFQLEDAQLDPLLRLVPDDHLSGSPTSSVVLIEYLDFQCPSCRSYQPVVNDLEDSFAGELLVVRRHLPLTQVHANAFSAAIAAEAAARQGKFEEMGNLLFENQAEWADASDPQIFYVEYATTLGLNTTQFVSDLSDTALADRVQRDADAAATLGATATPAFYLEGDFVADIPASLNGFSILIQSEVDAVDDVFRLNRYTGQLLVRDRDALDFETTPNFTIPARATDLDGDTEVLQAMIHLVDVGENPPQAVADNYTLNEDASLTVDAQNGILGNDMDADGDSLFPRVETNVAHGTLQLRLDGSFTYTPNANFHGTDTLVYQVYDGLFISDLTTATFHVNPINDLPQVANDAYDVDEGTTLDVNAADGVLANDSDVDGDTLIVTLIDGPAHGAVVLNADGSFSYTPAVAYQGPDAFTYRVNDGTVDSTTTATVAITVKDVNYAPVSVDDAYATQLNTVLTVETARGLLANDSDDDGDALIAQVVTQPGHGTLLLAADGTFQYTPDNDFSGTDSFTYQASDTVLDSNVATVTITVNPLNTFSLLENSPAGTNVGTVTATANDVGNELIYEWVHDEQNSLLNLVPDDHLSGDVAAPVVLIEYLDFQCPACQAYHPIIRQLENDFAGDLLVVRRHFPLTVPHQNAFSSAIATEAASRQGKFEEMGDLLFTNQDDWESEADPQSFYEQYATQLGLDLTQFRSDQADPALAVRVQRDLDNITTLGGSGTPTFYLQGAKLVTLPGSLSEFTNEVQAALDQVDDVFALNRLTGELTVRDPSALDFETSPSFTVDVRVADTDGDQQAIAVTVNLIDVDETSQGGVLAAFSVDEAMADDEAWLLPLGTE